MSEAVNTNSPDGVRVEIINMPENYLNLKTLATDHLTLLKNSGKNPDMENRYSLRYTGKDGETRISVQFRDPASEVNPDILRVGEGENAREVKVITRIWLTEKSDKEGEGHAICYKLGEDGKWYKQTSDKYRYDRGKMTTYWTLGQQVREVDFNEEQIELKSRIAKLQIPL